MQDFDYVIVADENGEPCLRHVGGRSSGGFASLTLILIKVTGETSDEDDGEEDREERAEVE